MAVTIKQLGSKLSYQDLNDIIKLFASATAPVNPYDGQIWLDIAAGNVRPVLKRYDSATPGWQDVSPVGGSGSGLDADKVDSLHASSFLRADANASFSGILTSTRTGAVIKFDNGHSMITAMDSAGHLTIKSGVDENNLVTVSNGGSRICMNENGLIKLGVTTQAVGAAFADNVYLTIDATGIFINGSKVWHAGNDGAASGLDADKLDGQEATAFAASSHNHDASQLTTGNIARGRLSNLWYDRNLTTSQNPFIQTGQEYISQLGAGTENIVFTYAFTDTPRVFCQLYGSTDVATLTRTYYISTTSARIYTMNQSVTLTSGTVDWLAIGAN